MWLHYPDRPAAYRAPSDEESGSRREFSQYPARPLAFAILRRGRGVASPPVHQLYWRQCSLFLISLLRWMRCDGHTKRLILNESFHVRSHGTVLHPIEAFARES